MKPALIIILILFFVNEAKSQIIVTDSSRLSETMWSMKKRKMVLDFMQLSEGEKASFWPLYEDYYESIRYTEMESLELLEAYHRLQSTSQDTKLMDRYSKKILFNEILLAKVRRQYYKKFSRAITAERAGEFMQFDDTLRMMIRMEAKLSGQSPEITHASAR